MSSQFDLKSDILEELKRLKRMTEYHYSLKHISKKDSDYIVMALNNSITFIEEKVYENK